MRNERSWILAVVALLATPAVASAQYDENEQAGNRASLGVDFLGGWQNLEPSRVSVGNAVAGKEGTTLLGGDVLGRIGSLGLGVAVNKTVSGSAQPWAGSLVAGVLVDLPLSLRLDLLGEYGRRAEQFGDLFTDTGTNFVGLRPGVSFHLGASPVRVGVTSLVRWPTKNGDNGDPDYSILGRVGLDL